MEKCKNTDQLEEIYCLYKDEMFCIAYGILKDYHEAENVVHSAVVKINSHIDPKLDPNTKKARAFVRILVKNIALNIYNKKKTQQQVDYESLENTIEDEKCKEPEVHIIDTDRAKHFAKQLSKLKREYADILVLRYSFEYSNTEIASVLDITEGNVRTRLTRAKKALRRIIRGDKYE